MRTTIELRDDLRAKLLEVAGVRRGEKGFRASSSRPSTSFVDAERAREEARGRGLLDAAAASPAQEADDLAARAAAIRETWR